MYGSSRVAYRAISRIFPLHFTPSRGYAKVMSSQPDPEVDVLPRSLLDTDFYKAR
jgi:hypothetical protein